MKKSNETIMEYPPEWEEKIKNYTPVDTKARDMRKAFIRSHFNYRNVDLADLLKVEEGVIRRIKKDILQDQRGIRL